MPTDNEKPRLIKVGWLAWRRNPPKLVIEVKPGLAEEFNSSKPYRNHSKLVHAFPLDTADYKIAEWFKDEYEHICEARIEANNAHNQYLADRMWVVRTQLEIEKTEDLMDGCFMRALAMTYTR